MKYLLATDSTDLSETLCAAVRDQLDDGDTVHAVNSLHGEDETTTDEIEAGRDALERVSAELGSSVSVDTHQFIRGNDPTRDVLAYADDHDVDQIVIGIRKRSPTGKAVFGSNAQDILLNATRPVLAVPRTD
ncbi:universal stress protein [Halorientalis salina]|uniref:universal stress protein n=1 Tax=Halorientalis salina TaxID=2932266 RepID=UPI002022A7BB|nr:universal stress protein [Halorientalis salina]